MIKIILSQLLSNKNKLLMLFYLIILALIFIIPLPFNEELLELAFNKEYYQVQYNELVIEFLKLLLPIIYLIILSEHDLRCLNNLTTYLGRFKIITNKIFIYLYINFINILIIIIYYLLIPKIFNFSFLTNSHYLNDYLSLLFDSFIITLLILLMNRHYQKISSYLIIAFYIIINFIYAFEANIIIYYLAPYYHNIFINFKYSFYYQVFYIMLLILLNYFKYLNEDFK